MALVSTHGGNRAALVQAARLLNDRYPEVLACAPTGDVGRAPGVHSGRWLTAVMLEGMKFAVGPTLAATRTALQSIGGMERVKDYLSSEDFMLGHIAAEAGFPVRLSTYVVEHRIGSESIASP